MNRLNIFLIVLVGLAAQCLALPCGLGERPRNCTLQMIALCLTTTRESCLKEDGTYTLPTWEKCCPSCIPVPCNCSFETIPICQNASDFIPPQVPSCPNCIPAPKCAILKCEKNRANISSCEENEFPKRDNDTCCPTCIPRRNGCWNETLRGLCNATLNSLPTCTNESAHFSFKECCFDNCVCPLPSMTKQSCTSLDYFRCLRDAPVCRTREVPCHLSDSCCASCKQPFWTFRAEEIAKCIANSPVCEQGEEPQHLEGELCATCRHPRPLCDLNCSDSEICVFTWDFVNDAPVRPLERKCVKATRLLFALGSSDGTVRKTLSELTKEEVFFLLRQFFDRFCDIPEHRQSCHQYLSNLRNVLIHLNKTRITIDVPEGEYQMPDSSLPIPTKRATTTASGLVSSAVTDTQVTSSVSVTAENPAPDTPGMAPTAPNDQPTAPNSQPTAPNGQPTAPNSQPTAPNSQPTAPSGAARWAASCGVTLLLSVMLFL